MNEELKVKSFRISEETTDKFKALCVDFDNQNTALSALINAYEVHNAKALLSNRQTEIEDYDVHLQALQRAFLQSLELNSNAEERIRIEFARQLDIKDNTIADYQIRLSELEQLLKDTEEKCRTDINTVSDKLTDAVNDVSEANKQISLLESDNAALKSSVIDKQQLIDNISKQLAEADIIKSEHTSLLKNIDELKKLNETEKAANNNKILELNLSISSLSNEIEKLKSTAEVKNEKHKVELAQAIAETKAKYLDIIEQLRTDKDSLKDEIYNLKIEKKI